MSSPVIKLKRGAFADLPTLSVGEPGFTTDRYQLYVGSSDGNKLIGGGEFWNLNSTTAGGGIKLYEATNNGTNFVELKAPDSIASNETFVLPGADGAADTVLKTDGSGNLTFVAVDTLSNAGLNNVVEDTSPQLGGNLDLNSSDVTGTGNVNITGNVTATGDLSVRGGNVVVNSTGVNVSGTLTATNLSGALNTSDLSGTITNAQLAGSIADDKLNQITTADKVSLVALDINGATDIGAALVDSDIFVVDDGGGGANRKATASRLKSYILGNGSGATFDNVTVGSGVTINTTGIDAPVGVITASSFVGSLTGNATSADTVDVTDVSSTNASFNIVLSDGASSSGRSLGMDSGLIYNPAANTLTTSEFMGDLTGDVTGNLTGAASQVLTQKNETTGTYFFTFVDSNDTSATANSLYTDSTLNLNPSTNIVSGGGMDMVAYFINSVEITSTATELNVLDGIPATLTSTELGYVDGVTSAIQTQLDAKGTLGNQTSLVTLSGVSAGSTTLGSFTGTTISDNKTVKGAIQELETQLDSIAGGGAQAVSISVGATDTDASFFPTFVSDNNATPTQETFKTDAGISYNPNSNLLTVAALSVNNGTTVAGDINANGNIVGDNATNITGVNQVTASTFVGALTGIATGATRVNITDHSNDSDPHYLTMVKGEGFQTLEEDDQLTYVPSTNTLSLVNQEVSGYIRFDGAGVQVDGITDEDNMSSNSATKLPTQQSVKAYVDTEVGNITSTITLNGDSTAGIVTTGNVLSIDGTANEIETAVVSDTFTIGLPNEVVVGTSVTAPTLYTSTVKAADGTACFTIANSTGKITSTDGLEVQGATTLASLTAQGNVSLGDQSTDTVGITGRVNTDVIPNADSTHQLGSDSLRWLDIYVDEMHGTGVQVSGAATAASFSGGSVTVTGDGTFGGSVNISGNLSVGGSITSVNVEDLKVVSPLIEVGLEDVGDGTSQPPSEITQYNNGIAMWYNTVGINSTNAKAASMFANVKPGGSFRIGFATDVSFPGAGVTEGVGTVNAWAGIEAKELWINDCSGQSQVISCEGSTRFLNNITVDGGSFS